MDPSLSLLSHPSHRWILTVWLSRGFLIDFQNRVCPESLTVSLRQLTERTQVQVLSITGPSGGEPFGKY